MNTSSKIQSYIASQCRENLMEMPVQGFVTISRQAGAGGITVGEKLAQYLDKQLSGVCRWTVFDKSLVQAVMLEHKMSCRILPYLREASISELDDMIGNLIDLHPPQGILVKKTAQTILRLAKLGRVILVGQGSPVITRDLPGGTHVRLIGSFKKRKAHLQEISHITDKEADAFINREDRGRAQYLKKYYDWNIDNPLLYDLVINTDTVSYDLAATMIGELAVSKIRSAQAISKK